jgi:hypothetical protein
MKENVHKYQREREKISQALTEIEAWYNFYTNNIFVDTEKGASEHGISDKEIKYNSFHRDGDEFQGQQSNTEERDVCIAIKEEQIKILNGFLREGMFQVPDQAKESFSFQTNYEIAGTFEAEMKGNKLQISHGNVCVLYL